MHIIGIILYTILELFLDFRAQWKCQEINVHVMTTTRAHIRSLTSLLGSISSFGTCWRFGRITFLRFGSKTICDWLIISFVHSIVHFWKRFSLHYISKYKLAFLLFFAIKSWNLISFATLILSYFLQSNHKLTNPN